MPDDLCPLTCPRKSFLSRTVGSSGRWCMAPN